MFYRDRFASYAASVELLVLEDPNPQWEKHLAAAALPNEVSSR